jgi:ribonuclease P protein component
VGSRLLVVHANQTDPRAVRPSRVGLVVSAGVGGAVVRNRVKRRLRAQLAALVTSVPAGTDIVVRAQPAAAGVGSEELRSELERLIHECLGRLTRTTAG